DQNGEVPPERQFLVILNPVAELLDLFHILQVLAVNSRKCQGDRQAEILLLVKLVLLAKSNRLPQDQWEVEFVKAPEVHGKRGGRRILEPDHRAVLRAVDQDILLTGMEGIATVG